MKFSVTPWADADEPVQIYSRNDLDTSYVKVGTPYSSEQQDVLHVKGPLEERVGFLRRLAAAAFAEAMELEEGERDGAPCCPDPGCPGRGSKPCTFPGYVEGN